MISRIPAAIAVAALVAAISGAPAALGQSAEPAPPTADMAKPAEGEEAKTEAGQAPLFSFERGELALLRKLAMRRKELEDREARLVERERLAAAMEAKIAAQADELKRLKSELEKQEARFEAIDDAKSEGEQERVRELAKAYKAMKPKDAARLFNDLDMELLTAIAREISPRVLAPVLAKMEPKRARELTEALRQS